MLKISSLYKSFGTKQAVYNLNLNIPSGAIFGFLGSNGAGKTTTLKMLMGLLQPDSGSVYIDGTSVAADPISVRGKVGFLPDEIFLYDYLTGYQFLEFVADIYKFPVAERKARIDNLLEIFDLSSVADEYTVNYSFGMKKKIALAGIILHFPKVLILDEPFNGLDPQAIRDLRTLLGQMVKNGTTIVFSSHVLEVVEKFVTHIGIISSGRLLVAEKMDKITADYGSLEKAFFKLTGH